MSEKRIKVGETDELATDGSRLITEVEGIDVAVFRLNGEYHAIVNHCIHQGGPLCEGATTGYVEVEKENWEWIYHDEEKIIVCPWHTWRFDITTGKNIEDSRYRVPTFDVEIEGSDIYVHM